MYVYMCVCVYMFIMNLFGILILACRSRGCIISDVTENEV